MNIRSLPLIPLAVAACMLLGCSSSAKPTSDSASARPTEVAQGQVTAQIASSEITVGPNRFVLGLLDSSGAPIADATAHFTFFQVGGAQATPKGEADATFRAPAREA